MNKRYPLTNLEDYPEQQLLHMTHNVVKAIKEQEIAERTLSTRAACLVFALVALIGGAVVVMAVLR